MKEINRNNNQPVIRKIPRMRTVGEAALELKKLDPNTAVTEYHIRRLAVSGKLPRLKAGKKYLINFDTLLDYLAQPGEEMYVEVAQGAD